MKPANINVQKRNFSMPRQYNKALGPRKEQSIASTTLANLNLFVTARDKIVE